MQHLVQMHYSGLGRGCSTVIEKELNEPCRIGDNEEVKAFGSFVP